MTDSRAERLQAMQDDDDPDEGFEPNRICPNCHGTGGEPYDDYVTPCEHCDGEGYEWWQ